MVEFNRAKYMEFITNESKEAYLTECFGNDEDAKAAAIMVPVSEG